MKNNDALFQPDRCDAFNEKAMERAAIACIEAFTDAFNARDLAGMDRFLHFPHVILSGENLVIWDRPGQLPDDFFSELTQQTGWRHTVYLDKRVVLVSPRKVHLYVQYSRNRADGSVITVHDNLWVVTWDDERWGIKQRSY